MLFKYLFCEHVKHMYCIIISYFKHLLQNNPSVYAHSAFILNYDEGGQFFDHNWVPTPPLGDEGLNCSTVTVEGLCCGVYYLFVCCVF